MLSAFHKQQYSNTYKDGFGVNDLNVWNEV